MYIDIHVHCRDGRQRHKETIEHALEVARDSGLDAIIDMPNSDPPLTSRINIEERISLAKQARIKEVFYGLYAGITKDPKQIKEMIQTTRDYREVVGMKMFAGHSVGNMGITEVEDQFNVYKTCAEESYQGLILAHCEKESLLDPTSWSHIRPISHCLARPEIAEIESVKDQLKLSALAGFKGRLHITHISSPTAVMLVNEAKSQGRNITCGICPHHFIYNWDQMFNEEGLLWKMNPPLREPFSRKNIFQYLKEGKIDIIETDHAPHSLKEKLDHPFMSGIPGLAWWPLFEEHLRKNNFSDNQIADLTFFNAQKLLGLDIQRKRRKIIDRRSDYPFDPYKIIAQELNWK